MKTLVVYDSVSGNTEQIARAVGDACGDTAVLHVSKVTADDLKAASLVIVGSPTHGGRPTPPIQGFLSSLPGPVSGMRAAAFDTRMPHRWVKLFGFAADRIAGALRGKGWTVVKPVEGFFVKGKEGPLLDGELQRAASWARALSQDSA